MYRALPASKQVASASGRAGGRVVFRRHLATDAAQTPAPKKRGLIRRIFWTTAAATGTFYVGSAFLALNNQTYYDIFSLHVPLGQSVLEYAESHGWDEVTAQDVIATGKGMVVNTQHFVTSMINGTPSKSVAVENTKDSQEKKSEAKPPFNVLKETKKPVAPKTETKKEPQAKKLSQPVQEAIITSIGHVSVSEDLRDLVQQAEAVIAGKPYPASSVQVVSPVTSSDVASQPSSSSSAANDHVYAVPLPIGFEPPPGFSRPSAPKKKKEAEPSEPGPSTPASLSLVAPAISSLSASEPIITHLAGTIDDLASYLASNPSAAVKANDILETAKGDLTALVERIEAVKEGERSALEAKLDEQTREYTLKLMEMEMEAQDRVDSQEEGFRKFFDEEKSKIIHAYREKLDNELKTQTELINERLKEEVIAQGIELQRRWIREIKVRVEQERSGRLAKLDELSANLKRLERIALDNSTYLDENIRIHALWSALRAVNSIALSSSVRRPFREELRILRHIATAREDPVVAVALDTLEGSEVPDVGVEPFADLASWFASEVSPRLSEVALVPDENAGVISYLASHLLSGLRFKRQGLVKGDDVLSVVARAGYYLNEKDLDSAARELNQLKGPAKTLLRDWLEAARRRLEVQQALEIVQTQATLSSILVV